MTKNQGLTDHFMLVSRSAQLPRLTQRQREALNGIFLGQSAKEIAQNLQVTRRTVEHHIGSLHKIFGVQSSSEIITLIVPEIIHKPEANAGCLSPSELEILKRIYQSKTAKEIGQEMGIPKRTIEEKSLNIRRKLNVASHLGLFTRKMDQLLKNPEQRSLGLD
jgi:DNA-binding CsgD family transcriptional regulator